MKKILAAICLMSALFGGCATQGKKTLLAEREAIALVSIISNGDINWKGEASIDERNLGPLVQRALRADPGMAVVTRADELINSAEQLIRYAMDGSGIILLADKEAVLGSKAYGEAKQNRLQEVRGRSGEKVKPEGYRFIDYRDKNFAASLVEETGIRRTMYVEFTFSKAMAAGVGKIGSCRAEVDMSVMILDSQGKNLYKKTYSLGSRGTTKASNGVYSQAEMLSLLESAITDACYDFLDDLGS